MALGIKFGPDWELEEKATGLLMKDRKARGGIRRGVDLDEYSWLSPWQLKLREDREVHNSLGYPDPDLFSGMFCRAYNPLFGKRVAGVPD